MFACMTYPFYEPNFLANVQKEVFFNVKRMREHPCLAIWSGNNEIEAMSNLWVGFPRSMHWNEQFFYHILPEWVALLDRTTPYIPGSPCGTAQCKDVQTDGIGDTHLWAVWHGLAAPRLLPPTSHPFLQRVRLRVPPRREDHRATTPTSPRTTALESPVFNAHQKCASGNKKMVYYIASRFDLPKPTSTTTSTSRRCARASASATPPSSGAAPPSAATAPCSGSSTTAGPSARGRRIDYFGNYKCLQYRAKHFFAPVIAVQAVADKTGCLKVRLINDRARDLRAARSPWKWRPSTGERRCTRASSRSCALSSGCNGPYDLFRLTADELGGAKALRCLLCLRHPARLRKRAGKTERSTALFAAENKLQPARAAKVTAKQVGVMRRRESCRRGRAPTPTRASCGSPPTRPRRPSRTTSSTFSPARPAA